MLKACPESVDTTDLQFKLQCRLKVFDNDDVSSFSSPSSLVTCASRYGLLFIASNSNSFQVIQTQILQNYSPKDKDIKNYPRRNVQIPSPAKHICANCDNTIIAVIVEKDQCPVVIFYEVLSFLQQNIRSLREVRLSSTPGVHVREINWNPSLPSIFTACKSDGSLGVYEIKGDSVDINELPTAANATCFCWSPKGKQIAVGSKDGKITQYKPDLKAVKAINGPKLEGPCSIISLQWVSNYQFIGVYEATQDGACYIIVIDSPKVGESSYTNYEDICYSGSSRPAQYYLILQQVWNFLMVASANSTEVGVLGSNGESWTQWIMQDTARAELPLSQDHQETLPVGMTFDISSTNPLPWGESTIPPCPLLCILSHQGVLCCFNVIFLKEGVPSVCTPPDPVRDTSGLSSFVTSSDIKKDVINQVQAKLQKATPEVKSEVSSVETPSKENIFALPKNTVTQNMPIIQSTPLAAGKTASDLTSKTLFGGQATITPIKPLQNPVAPNVSVSATGGEQNFNQKYASIFATLNPNSSPSNITATAPVKPIVINASSVKPPEPIVSKLQVSTFKDKGRSVAAFKQDQQIVDIKADTSEMLYQMIKEEWMYLETELKVLLDLGRAIKVNVGTDQEKVDMVEQIDSLHEFVREAVEISVGQSNEIHCLKQNLIQSWAWFEEAKSHYNASKDETVALLIRLQPLDSLSQKRLKDIEQLIYYIDSQLSQAMKTLDEQWDNFQDYAKKTYKVKMPTMETIFQTMVRQNAVLQKLSYFLKDISLRLRKRTSNISSLLLSLDKCGDLADDFKDLRLVQHDIWRLQYEKIKSYTKNLSNVKARKLRNLVYQREVTHVTAIKPQISSWTLNQSPASRIRQSISRLGSSPSSAPKISIARNLDFSELPDQSAQGLPVSFKPAATSNTGSGVSNFVSLLKSGPVISSSQGSAFTPVCSAVTSVTAASNSQQLFKFNSNASLPSNSQVSFSNQIPTGGSSSFVPTTSTTPALNLGANAASVFKPMSDKAPNTTNIFRSNNSTSAIPKSMSQQNLKTSQEAPQLASSITVTSSAGSGFVTPSSKATSGVASIFANLQSVIDKATTPVTSSSDKFNVTTTQSVFGSLSSSTVANKSLFGAPAEANSGGIFTPHTSQDLFGSATSSPTFTSVFGKSASATDSSENNLKNSFISESTDQSGASNVIEVSLFGSNPTASEPNKNSVEPTSKATTLFGSGPTSQPDKNIFGKSAESVTSAQQTAAVTTVSPPLFGSPKTSTSQATSVIFSSAVATSPKPSIFGSSASSTISSATGTNANSISAAATTKSNFGTTTVFGVPSSNNAHDSSSPTTKASIFGSPTTGGIFGAATSTTTTSSVSFSSLPANASGVPPVAPAATGVSATSSASETAAKAKVFGLTGTIKTTATSGSETSAAPSSASASIFGDTTAKSSIFGAATAGTIFGAASPTATPASSVTSFGTPASLGTSAASSPTNIFGSSTSGNKLGAATCSATTTSSVGPSSSSAASGFGTSTSTSVFGTAVSDSASSKPSIFGTLVTAGSLFGAATTTVTTTSSVNSTSSFGTSAFGTAASDSVVSKTSIFGSPAAGSILGSATTIATTTASFGTPVVSSATSPFGSSVTSAPAFGTPTTSSVFGSPSAGSIFGVAASATTTSTAAFGTTPSGSGAFGTTTGSIFGAVPSSTGNIFASPAASSPTAFGASSPTKPFGSSAAPTTTPSVFGSNTTTASSPFGTQSGSIFGSSSTGFSQTGPFGGTQNSTTSSIFGQPSTFGSSSANPIFGSTTTAANTTGNIFGNTSSTGFGTGFGATATTNAFGSPTVTQPPTGSFGFGSLSVGGTSSSGSIFGGVSGSATFGQAPVANPFGKVESTSAFGSSSSSIFGNPAATTSATANIFASPTSTTSSIFGSASGAVFGSTSTAGGFGSPSVFGSPAFGQKPAFGQPAGFGSTTFGTPQSGPFSSGGTSPVAQSGFGSPAGFSKQATAFGSAPVFGGSPAAAPAFGAPAFGGTATFGSTPVFGSPEKVFGSNSQVGGGGFTSAAQQSAGFGNIASQNTIGFGNLAQQANTPTSMPFSGGSSFSSWR